MTALNVIALLMNMAGMVIAYMFSISPMTPKGGRIYIYSEEELRQRNTSLHKKERRYKKISLLGLWISLLGMIFQFVLSFFSCT
ncbi:hypothetical protein [Capnocytophaga granulosa]|jgi:hypothetical protein|uniref:hypothetical protein n=1 Tax=Capnocytophaga granulosa TaxID=45242 RepID=UPI0023EFDF4F|nr:hypothetical protein [Capnocytophaga granulosa]